MNNAATNFVTLTTNLNVLHNYFDSSTKLFWIFQQNRSFHVYLLFV